MKRIRQLSTTRPRRVALLGCVVVFALAGFSVAAAQPAATDYVALAKEGSYVLKNFPFARGGTLAELRLNYATWGEPKKDRAGNITNAVLLCHGSMLSWHSFASPWWAAKMYGPGQPLDLTKYFIIASDTIGSGKSSKPSDGLRMKFPKYTHDDVVKAQHTLLTEGLGIRQLHAVIGISYGGRQVWQWGVQYPELVMFSNC